MVYEDQNFKMGCTEDPKEPFFHFIPSEKAKDFITLAAEKKGSGFFVVEGRLGTKDELLSSIGGALSFPDYFGGNWDALDECIKDLSWLPAQGYALLFSNGDDLLKLPKKDWDILFGVFSDAAESWHDEGKPFHIMLVGGDALRQRFKALVDKAICFHYT